MEPQIPFLSLKKITALHAAEIQEAVTHVVNSGWYLKGIETERFERNYAQYIGTRHCVGCGNGLDALWLILRAYRELGVMHEGDEVIVPANTYIASILAITDNRLTPVLVEPRLDTLQIDDSRIEQAITPRTRAIMIVHLYGRCAYTDRIGQLCREHHLKLIEDNAQAHGCTFGDRRTGSLGDAAGHSFYPTKNLGALGDAGCVTTDDEALSNVVRALGNYGSERHHHFQYKGRNSRMDELQAAVLNVKLKHLEEDNHHRHEIALYYNKYIENPLVQVHDAGGVYHLYPILCPERDALRDYLKQQGIGTDIHYPVPPHEQPAYKEWNQCHYPITERIHREILSLPCNPAMTMAEAARVAEAVNSWKDPVNISGTLNVPEDINDNKLINSKTHKLP